ncbi:superoxide dismutase family protein [bacterium]|nr:superoxide dismutase family protein [bacterium]MBR2274022.1 superoxide dismutase family protein [Alphaproteobacteria bacterium]
MEVLLALMFLLASCHVQPHAAHADVYLTTPTGNGQGEKIGTVKMHDEANGITFYVNLEKLPAGAHGFHIHNNPACSAIADRNGNIVLAQAAGAHFDPEHTGRHLGPNKNGHKGDLPVLFAHSDGTVHVTLFRPDLSVRDIIGRSLIIHASGDNYQDVPQPLGGGGERIACAIIKAN